MNILRHFLRTRAPLRDASGQALVLAILIILVLIIATTAIAGYVASNETNSGRERSAQQALAAGESGLDYAANQIALASTPPATAGSGSTPDPNGYTVNWTYTPITSGTYAGGYTLQSTATSPNGKVTRILQEVLVPKVEDRFTTTSVANTFPLLGSTSGTSTSMVTTVQQPSSFWGYGFVMGGSPSGQPAGNWCGSVTPSPTSPLTLFGGSGLISVPTWITGDVCITGGANPAIGNPTSGSAIPVHIGGSLAVNGPNYAIGTPSNLVASADIAGCWSDFHGWHNVACTSTTQDANNGGSGVYAVPPYTAGGSGVTPPTLSAAQMASAYTSADFGPQTTSCTQSGTFPAGLFGTNGSGPTHSLGTKNLRTILGSTAFDCKMSNGNELKWTPGSPGTLYLKGTAFFDGDLTMAGADYIKLAQNSNGSIYVYGYLKLTNDGSICAYFSGTTCSPGSDSWSPGTNPSDPVVFFGVFDYNNGNGSLGFDLEGNSNLEGLVLTNNGFYLSNSAQLAGSIFANYGTVNGAGNFKVTGSVPAGAIGGITTVVTPVTSTYGTTATIGTGTTTVTTYVGTTWNSSYSIAPGTWRQCPVTGCS